MLIVSSIAKATVGNYGTQPVTQPRSRLPNRLTICWATGHFRKELEPALAIAGCRLQWQPAHSHSRGNTTTTFFTVSIKQGRSSSPQLQMSHTSSALLEWCSLDTARVSQQKHQVIPPRLVLHHSSQSQAQFQPWLTPSISRGVSRCRMAHCQGKGHKCTQDQGGQPVTGHGVRYLLSLWGMSWMAEPA